jgi:hypothetical protein
MPRRCCPATATSTAASTPMPSRPSSPRRRWWWPTPSPAPSASTSRRTRSASTLDGKPVTLKDLWPSDAEIDAIVKVSVKPEQFRKRLRSRCSPRRGARRACQAAVRLAPAEHLHPPPAVLGRRAGRRAHAQGHAPAGAAGRQHHHRSPVAVERDPARQRGRRVPGEDGPAGGGLQFLRHPPRRSPDRAARHLRQPRSWSTRWRWSTAR